MDSCTRDSLFYQQLRQGLSASLASRSKKQGKAVNP